MTERAAAATDIVVVGGGPAGCAAAIAARRAGADVVLLERERAPRDRPGETLAPGLEPLLDWLGAGDVLPAATLARHPGHWSESRAGRQFVPFGNDASGDWRGFQVWRRTFDAALRQRAADLGVDVRLGAAVKGVLRDAAGGVRGVTSLDSAPVRAHVVIDASGGRHWLARTLGIGVARLSPRYVASFGYTAPSRRRDLPREPLFRFESGGWTWIAPIGDHGFAWTRMSFAGQRPSAGRRPALLRRLRPTHATRGADVTWRMARSVAGRGWLIAGDAGAVLDPAASHGVLRAITSGVRAGVAAADAWRDPGTTALAFTDFDAWFRSGILRDASTLRRMYDAATCPEERGAQ